MSEWVGGLQSRAFLFFRGVKKVSVFQENVID